MKQAENRGNKQENKFIFTHIDGDPDSLVMLADPGSTDQFNAPTRFYFLFYDGNELRQTISELAKQLRQDAGIRAVFLNYTHDTFGQFDINEEEVLNWSYCKVYWVCSTVQLFDLQSKFVTQSIKDANVLCLLSATQNSQRVLSMTKLNEVKRQFEKVQDLREAIVGIVEKQRQLYWKDAFPNFITLQADINIIKKTSMQLVMLCQRTNHQQIYEQLLKLLKTKQYCSEWDIQQFQKICTQKLQNYNIDNKKWEFIKYYTNEDITHRVINYFLRLSTDPTSLFYIQPLYKGIFQQIKILHHQQRLTLHAKFQYRDGMRFVCYRGAKFTQAELNFFRTNSGVVIQMLGFLSASHEEREAVSFSQNALLIIEVEDALQKEESNSGYAFVDQISYFPKQRQIIFNPLSYFLIVGVDNVQKQHQNKIKKLSQITLKYSSNFIESNSLKEPANTQSQMGKQPKKYETKRFESIIKQMKVLKEKIKTQGDCFSGERYSKKLSTYLKYQLKLHPSISKTKRRQKELDYFYSVSSLIQNELKANHIQQKWVEVLNQYFSKEGHVQYQLQWKAEEKIKHCSILITLGKVKAMHKNNYSHYIDECILVLNELGESVSGSNQLFNYDSCLLSEWSELSLRIFDLYGLNGQKQKMQKLYEQLIQPKLKRLDASVYTLNLLQCMANYYGIRGQIQLEFQTRDYIRKMQLYMKKQSSTSYLNNLTQLLRLFHRSNYIKNKQNIADFENLIKCEIVRYEKQVQRWWLKENAQIYNHNYVYNSSTHNISMLSVFQQQTSRCISRRVKAYHGTHQYNESARKLQRQEGSSKCESGYIVSDLNKVLQLLEKGEVQLATCKLALSTSSLHNQLSDEHPTPMHISLALMIAYVWHNYGSVTQTHHILKAVSRNIYKLCHQYDKEALDNFKHKLQCILNRYNTKDGQMQLRALFKWANERGFNIQHLLSYTDGKYGNHNKSEEQIEYELKGLLSNKQYQAEYGYVFGIDQAQEWVKIYRIFQKKGNYPQALHALEQARDTYRKVWQYFNTNYLWSKHREYCQQRLCSILYELGQESELLEFLTMINTALTQQHAHNGERGIEFVTHLNMY